MPAWRSPIAAKRAGMVASVKSAGSHASISSHASGAETRASGRRPHGVRGGDRAVLGVLVVVEKHALAFFLPPLARRAPGHAPLDFARQRQRGATHLVERPAPLDAHVDVHAARARGLRPAHQAEVLERRPDHAGDLANLRPLHAGHRIEIDAQLVGMVEVVGANRVRVQFEAGEVGHPHERRRLAAARSLRPCGPTGNFSSTTSSHGGSRLRRALLEEELAADAVGVADQHVGPAAGALQRALGDGNVVARQIELGVAGLQGTGPSGVRNRDLATRHGENLLFDWLGHRPPLNQLDRAISAASRARREPRQCLATHGIIASPTTVSSASGTSIGIPMTTISFGLLRGICQLPAYIACEKGLLRDVGVEPAVTISPSPRLDGSRSAAGR